MNEEEIIVTTAEQAPVSTTQSLAIPIAIVIAGLAIAAALYFGGKNNAPTQAAAGTNQPAKISVDPVVATDHILGNPNAKIVIVEYSDTECPFCKTFHPTLARIMDEYGNDGKVAWVYRHFPLPFHTKSPNEAQAVECANKLGGNTKFWEYLNRIFDITPANNQLDPVELTNTAKTLGLDLAGFNKCLSSGEMKSIVDNDLASGTRAGLQGTPYSILLVDKKVAGTINGAQPYEAVKAQIDQLLK